MQIQPAHSTSSYRSPSPTPPPLDLSRRDHQARRTSPVALCMLSSLPSACGMCVSPAIRRRMPAQPALSAALSLCADALVRLLHFNQAATAAPKAEDEVYKVLVLDRYTKDILAPLLRLNDLRKHGITLHLVRHQTSSPHQHWPKSLHDSTAICRTGQKSGPQRPTTALSLPHALNRHSHS